MTTIATEGRLFCEKALAENEKRIRFTWFLVITFPLCASLFMVASLYSPVFLVTSGALWLGAVANGYYLGHWYGVRGRWQLCIEHWREAEERWKRMTST